MITEPTTQDLLLIGAGPAALALAGRASAHGLRVACVAPTPTSRWGKRYGCWADEIDDELRGCEEASWAAPSVWTSPAEEIVLPRRYVALESGLLQDHLLDRAAGVDLVPGQVVAVEQDETGSTAHLASGSSLRARLVVDATGGAALLARESGPPVAWQTAWGELLEVESHPFFEGEMVFMDLRSLGGAEPGDPPSFLYAQPLGRHRIFVEETSLLAAPAVPVNVLQARLRRRLRGWGIQPREVLGVERCRIPMTLPLPDRGQRLLGYGAAASMVHPATGYQVARSLSRAPAVAQAIADGLDGASLDRAAASAWSAIWPRADLRNWELYTFGARFVATLDGPRLERFFRAFFSLPATDWSGFLSGTLSTHALAAVMTRLFAGLDSSLRWELMRAGMGSGRAPIFRAALAH